MEFLRRILTQIKSQLGDLTLSQRLVIALLLVIMGGAILTMVNYAAKREKVPLLNQSIDKETLDNIVNQLEMWGETYEVQDGKILVASSRHQRLYSKLAYAEALPGDTSVGWDLLLEETSMFIPESERQNRKTIVSQRVLANMISYWPGVKRVHGVIINRGDKRRLNNMMPAASASVSLETNGKIPPQRLAISVAAFVSGANNRMNREDVIVNIDGKNVPVVGEDEEYESGYLSVKKEYEKDFVNKITMALPPGMDAIVQVNVKWNNVKSQRHIKQYAPDGEGSLSMTVEEESREDKTSTQDVSEESGLMANIGDNGQGGGESQSSATEESTGRKQNFAGLTDTVENKGMGGVEEVTASVMISDEYFQRMAKSDGEEKPDPAAVQALMDQELPKFKKVVWAAIGLDESFEKNVVVITYKSGGGMALNQGQDDYQAESTSITGMAVRYGKHIAVSSLAMVSLVMVLMMVRKSMGPVEVSEDDVITMIAGNRPVDALGIEDVNLDDGEGGDALLSGMEMDEESIRSHQVLQQIRDMVSESPDDASTLVSKWISQVT
jgi:flagellar biosynthesis/type III secretory pathway M-ring protein FliF/YscJ